MEQKGWATEVVLPEEMTLREVAVLLEDLKARPCLKVQFRADTRMVTLYLIEPGILKDAPSGTHEFAHGWLMHADAVRAAHYLKTLDWEPIKIYDQIRIVMDSSPQRSGFRL